MSVINVHTFSTSSALRCSVNGDVDLFLPRLINEEFKVSASQPRRKDNKEHQGVLLVVWDQTLNWYF